MIGVHNTSHGAQCRQEHFAGEPGHTKRVSAATPSPTTRSWDDRLCLVLDQHPLIAHRLLLRRGCKGWLFAVRVRDLLVLWAWFRDQLRPPVWAYGVIAQIRPVGRALIYLLVLLIGWLRGGSS